MKLKTQLLNWLPMVAGSAILAFGLFNVHDQSRITEGGVLGTTLLLQYWFGISPAVTEALLDVTCYLLGIRYLGRDFLPKALVATASYSLCYRICEHTGYLLPDLTGHPLAAALLGSVFVGIGVGIVVRAGGAAGGDDALALVLSRVFHAKISRCYLFTDLTVLLLSASYIPLKSLGSSLLTVTLSSILIEKVQSFHWRPSRFS